MNLIILDCILGVLEKLGLSEAAKIQIINNPKDLFVIAANELNISLVKIHELYDLANKWYHDKDMSIFDFKL
jgi:hypothetical protein